MRLKDIPDWKVVHFPGHMVLKSDRPKYPAELWDFLLTKYEVKPMDKPGHYELIWM